eukprot:3281683-Rhodomonas_salina.2
MGCLNSVPEEPRESAIGQTIKSCRIVRGHEEKGSDGTWQSYGHFAGFELELGNGTFFLYKAAGPDPSFTSFNIRGYEMAVGGNVKKEDFESFMQVASLCPLALSPFLSLDSLPLPPSLARLWGTGPGVPDHPDHFCAIEQYMRNRYLLIRACAMPGADDGRVWCYKGDIDDRFQHSAIFSFPRQSEDDVCWHGLRCCGMLCNAWYRYHMLLLGTMSVSSMVTPTEGPQYARSPLRPDIHQCIIERRFLSILLEYPLFFFVTTLRTPKPEQAEKRRHTRRAREEARRGRGESGGGRDEDGRGLGTCREERRKVGAWQQGGISHRQGGGRPSGRDERKGRQRAALERSEVKGIVSRGEEKRKGGG